MRPAFDSPKQAAGFGLLLVFFLIGPWLAGRELLPPREQAYASEGWVWGPYPWVQKEIFHETNDLDIVFIGSSHLLWDIDTPYVQEKLDERVGRHTVVRTICWGGAGFDELYYATRDLLARRRVRTLVFYDESDARFPNPKTPHWFRYGDDPSALAGLPSVDRGMYYFAAMVGLPRALAEWITPNLPEDPDGAVPNRNEVLFHAENPEHRLGSIAARVGYDPAVLGANQHFVPFRPQTTATPADVCIYSPATATNFVFSNRQLPAWQTHFARQFGLLARSHNCQLVMLHLPKVADGESPLMTEPRFWPDVMQAKVVTMGIPNGRLFAGLSAEAIKLLYADPVHFNLNGQEYYTPLVTPALLQIYENSAP